jgi:hypothetical protein
MSFQHFWDYRPPLTLQLVRSREARSAMISQETIPDNTLYQVFMDVAQLVAITDDFRSIKTVL